MGVKKIYDKLVLKWGRELANEIIAKRLAQPNRNAVKVGRKNNQDALDSQARLDGSFESGTRR